MMSILKKTEPNILTEEIHIKRIILKFSNDKTDINAKFISTTYTKIKTLRNICGIIYAILKIFYHKNFYRNSSH